MRLIFAAVLLMLSLTSRAQSLGPELVVNGGFETADNWSLGYSWQILPAPGALAFHNEGYTAPLEQSTAVLQAGLTYRVAYTVSGTFSSTDPRLQFRFRGANGFVSCPFSSGDGVFTCDLVAPVGVNKLLLRPLYGFGGILDDVSVREVLP